MKIKLLPALVTLAGFLSAPFVLASSYQGEISASYGDSDLDVNGLSIDGKFIGLQGKYYFSPVNTANHPLAEAAFIEKSSNVYVQLDNSELKYAGEKADSYSRSIGIDFYIPNSIFYLGAGVTETKFKGPAGSGVSSDWESNWFVKAGVAPITGLLIWSEFVEDVDVSDQWNINGKYVLPLSGEQALNLEASYEKVKIGVVDYSISMAADYYIDRNLSVGAGFVNTSYDSGANGSADTDYFVRARNFFTDKASVELSYIDGDYERSFMIGGTLRF
jgi:hypothetical protein